MEKFLKYAWLLSGLLIILSLISIGALNDNKLHIYVLDIGQGDSILVRTPAQEYILIDGGPNDKALQELSKIMPFYERTIDILILSHPHADHTNGFVEILKRYEVKQILLTGVRYSNSAYESLLELATFKKIPLLFVHQSQDYALGAIILDVLYPFESIQGTVFENVNNSSLTFRLLYDQKKFYFAGDLEMEKEAELVKRHLNLEADFFKASHHGSKTSNTESLLDRIKPQYAAISCGVDNQFGHPFYTTIQHFQERGIKIFRTDLNGLIEAVSDGENLEVKGWGK